jgi:hypothetical protein
MSVLVMRGVPTSRIAHHRCWVINRQLDVRRLRYVDVLCTIDVDRCARRRKESFHLLQKFSCNTRISRCPVLLSIRIVFLDPFLHKDRCAFESIHQLSFVLLLYL